MTSALDYVQRAVGKLPPLKLLTRTKDGGFYTPGSRKINMRLDYRTENPNHQAIWRHEYGHHVDNMLGNGRYISGTRTWEAAWRTDAKSATDTAFRAGQNKARDAADQRARDHVQEMKAIKARDGIQARDRWLREVFSQSGLNYDEWNTMIEEGIKASALQAPGAKPITDSLQFLAAYEHGAVTSDLLRMWGSGRVTQMGINFMDTFGAITKEQVGYGHGVAYYNADLRRQGAEAFANVFSAISHKNPMWGKLAERFFPNLTRLVKGALENA